MEASQDEILIAQDLSGIAPAQDQSDLSMQPPMSTSSPEPGQRTQTAQQQHKQQQLQGQSLNESSLIQQVLNADEQERDERQQLMEVLGKMMTGIETFGAQAEELKELV